MVFTTRKLLEHVSETNELQRPRAALCTRPGSGSGPPATGAGNAALSVLYVANLQGDARGMHGEALLDRLSDGPPVEEKARGGEAHHG